jgi:hypothetical protein
VERVWHAEGPLDLRRTLAPLRHGPRDPTYRVDADGALWRATLTPDGPATARLTQQGHEIACAAWGPGAEWVLEQLPHLCGADLSGVTFGHAQLDAAHRGSAGLRIPRTARVMESLVPAILEQKVTGKEAFEAYAVLVRRYGEPAPGPCPPGLSVPPAPAVWGRIPSWDWHTAGVDPRRMRTVLAAARVSGRLEEAVGMSPDSARARLRAVPGVGEWTAAEVAARALGDTDAVSVGDFHLAAAVGWALVGRPVDDAGMLELLEPWRPHRALAVRLIEEVGPAKPRFGPRLTVQDHRRH